MSATILPETIRSLRFAGKNKVANLAQCSPQLFREAGADIAACFSGSKDFKIVREVI